MKKRIIEMMQALLKVSCNIVILVAVVNFASANSEKCYRVYLKDSIHEASCAPVKVTVSIVSCSQPTVVISDHGDFTSTVDCQSSPMKLKTPHEGGMLVSDLKKTDLWGQTTYQVDNTHFQEGEKSSITLSSVAKGDEVKEPLLEKKKTKKKKQKRETASLPEPPQPRPLLPAQISTQAVKREPSQPNSEVPVVVSLPPETVKPPEVNFKFSGTAWVEMESSKNFGYDGSPPTGSGGTNFLSSASNSEQNFSTFFSLLQLDASKGPTQLTSVFEIGEVVAGESTTGGNQGAGQKSVEVRNLYLTHNFDSHFSLKAGLQPLSSDPNNFIISDHYSSGIFSYQNDFMNTSLWTAKAFDNKPGSVNPDVPDQYLGFQSQFKFNDSLKDSIYGVSRSHTESLYDENSGTVVKGKSNDQWVGTTANWNFWRELSVEGSYIYNHGAFAAENNGPTDSFSASLADVKLTQSWKEEKIDLLLEALMTSGASGSVASGQSVASLGKRKGFSSPDPGASYLLTLATSDGVDDAPGSKKESIIGNLSQLEGLQASIFKISKAFTPRLSAFFRYGILKSNAENDTSHSKDMGQEWDIEGSYELSPGTILQIDYAEFSPGSFYVNRDKATLFTSRLKFSF